MIKKRHLKVTKSIRPKSEVFIVEEGFVRTSREEIYTICIYLKCRERIRQIKKLNESYLINELNGEKIELVPLNSPFTVTLDGERIECRDLQFVNNREIYCIPVNGEKYSRININLLKIEDLKMIDDTMGNDIKKTEELLANNS